MKYVLLQGDYGGWESWKISYFLNWAGQPVLFSDRDAGKAGLSTFEY